MLDEKPEDCHYGQLSVTWREQVFFACKLILSILYDFILPLLCFFIENMMVTMVIMNEAKIVKR